MIFDYSFPGAPQMGFSYVWSAGVGSGPPPGSATPAILSGLSGGAAHIIGG